jgi:hypothetical protein
MLLPLLMLLGAAAPDAPSTPAPERMNDIQTVGTHNSYKQPMPAQTMAKIRATNPRMADALDYSHRPLTEQLDAGARQLEIDVNYDPQGGYYARGSSDPRHRQFKQLRAADRLPAYAARLVGCPSRPSADHADVQRQGRA